MKIKIISAILAVALLVSCFVVITGAKTSDKPSKSYTVTDDDIKRGIVLDKTITEIDKVGDKQQFEVCLEAFSLGEEVVVETEAELPLDIVIVVDQSGSMDESITSYSYSKSTNKTNSYYYSNGLFELVDGEYKQVTVKRTKTAGSGWGILDPYKYRYSYSFSDGNKYTSDDDAENDTPTFDRDVYVRSSSGSTTKLKATKTAITNFVNSVQAAGKKYEVDHRVAIVGYASNYDTYSSSRCENTELFIGSNQYNYYRTSQSTDEKTLASAKYGEAFQKVNTTTGFNNITASINALDGEGGTYPSNATEMVNGIFAATDYTTEANKERKKFVIIFTDGMPGSGSSFSSTEANATLEDIYTAKNTHGAQVFTVGVFNGADASTPAELPSNSGSTNQANRFLHLLSSNYPKATKMDTTGDINEALDKDTNYYLIASDAAELEQVFQTVYDRMQETSVYTKLTSKAQIRDIMTPYFSGPATKEEISVYYQDCKTYDKATGEMTFGDPYAAEDLDVSVIATDPEDGDAGSSRTVIVTDFDYSTNWCGLNAENNARGKKLVIKFVISPRNGFFGGNGVPTNDAASGIYDENGNGVDGLQFPIPDPQDIEVDKVGFAIEEIDGLRKNVYLYSDLTEAQLVNDTVIVTVNKTAIEVDNPEGNYGLPSWMNDYVDLEYNINPTFFENVVEDNTYHFDATIAPKNGGTYDGNSSSTDNAPIVCYYPHITFKDTAVERGTVADYDDNFVKLEWRDKDGNLVPDGMSMVGEAPDLTYEYDPATPSTIDDTTVNVKVYMQVDGVKTDITSYTTFHHETCDCADVETCDFNPDNGEFMIHVLNKLGDLTVKNTVTGEGADANQTFVYTITGPKNYTQTVAIKGNGSVTVKDLPVGDYTVTIDKSWSYNYTPDNESKNVKVVPAGVEAPFVNTINTTGKNWGKALDYVKNFFGSSGITATK